jgi:hypothetical protein
MLAIRFPGVSRPAPSDEMQSFGPAVGVMKVASDEEAIRLMNYSSYDGLTASVCSSLCPLDPGADLRAAVERITIRCTTLEIQLAEGMAEDSSDRILVIPGRRQRPIDAVRSFREKANDPLPCDRCGLRRARFSLTRFATPIAGKTN